MSWLNAQRPDGYVDGENVFQGVRAYDPDMNQWTTPDAYAGNVHDPMSQKPYLWNNNNPVSYSDYSGNLVTNLNLADPFSFPQQALPWNWAPDSIEGALAPDKVAMKVIATVYAHRDAIAKTALAACLGCYGMYQYRSRYFVSAGGQFAYWQGELTATGCGTLYAHGGRAVLAAQPTSGAIQFGVAVPFRKGGTVDDVAGGWSFSGTLTGEMGPHISVNPSGVALAWQFVGLPQANFGWSTQLASHSLGNWCK